MTSKFPASHGAHRKCKLQHCWDKIVTMGLKKNKKKKDTVTPDPRVKGSSRADLVLRIVASDNTFECLKVGDNEWDERWLGKCIHCGTKLVVDHRFGTGTVKTNATVEHIMPLTAGGSGTDLLNLALACSRCNNWKGIHHDQKNLDTRAREVISALLEKRSARFRGTVTNT